MPYQIVSELTDAQVAELVELYHNEFWSQQRQLEDVLRMLNATNLIVGIVDEQDHLIGFTRILTDFVYRALIFDVIVKPSHRGQGLGTLLIDTVVNHPKLQAVEYLGLCCLPEMIPFYNRWGFSESADGIRLLFRAHASP
ncbi:GNAT family N-acetyltransferase [Leptothermofonsia sp. ETS-13]|uniref:GNAT family N-acetyltransferase n=1 Tax=Leptothermofonsia sp. ETS-13 TaxID=3035696 RepID=UPI003BA2FFE9